MKVMTVLGTRPEIIRLSRIIPLLDDMCEHVVVHTGQNYERSLNDVFFEELELRAPDVHLAIAASDLGEQLGALFERSYRVLAEHRPDQLLILGDTNSALVSIVARRLGIPVFHLEAGNRCYDSRVPEEINRRVIDHSSSVLMPYTGRSMQYLLAEGFRREQIHVVGNPIGEVLRSADQKIKASSVLRRLGLVEEGFCLATVHRAETVDNRETLVDCMRALAEVSSDLGLPVICSLHPRTRSKLASFGIEIDDRRVRLVEPLGFFDFVRLTQTARCVLTDSGTVLEECGVLGARSVVLREVTERPEMVEAGCTILAGTTPRAVLDAVRLALKMPTTWSVPQEYLDDAVSSRVAKILFSYHAAFSPSGRKQFDR